MITMNEPRATAPDGSDLGVKGSFNERAYNRWRAEQEGTMQAATQLQATEVAEPENWRAEVTTTDDLPGTEHWYGNGLRFADRDHALEYARDLARRWMKVTRWRAVPDSTPKNEVYTLGSEDGKW